MVHEMVERVRESIFDRLYAMADGAIGFDEARDVAEMAIKAMREPTAEMLRAARDTYYDPAAEVFAESEARNPDRHLLRMAKYDYQAMIDAALKE